MNIGKNALIGEKIVKDGIEKVWATDYKTDAIFMKGKVKDLRKMWRKTNDKNGKRIHK